MQPFADLDAEDLTASERFRRQLRIIAENYIEDMRRRYEVFEDGAGI